MTPFSTVLESLMKEKNIKTYAIAQYCGIDRSNMLVLCQDLVQVKMRFSSS